MGRNKYNSVFKQKIIDDYNPGTTQSELCKKYKMLHTVISRLINKYKTKRTVETEHLGGRPKKSTPRIDLKIIRYVKKNPFVNARDTIRKLKLDISENTVLRRLDNAWFYSYHAAKNLSNRQRTKNRVWSSQRLTELGGRTVETKILWSDSKFNLKGSDGKKNVTRPVGKRLKQVNSIGTINHEGGKGLMFWG